MAIDPGYFQTFSIIGLVLVFAGGVVTSIGPCNLAMIPLVMSYVGGSHNLTRRRSFLLSSAFAVGLAITFVILGMIAALAGTLLGGSSNLWYYLAAAVCIVLGMQMLGALPFTFPSWFGGLRERVHLKDLWGALALGLISGLVASQCATPVLAAILTFVVAEQLALAYAAVLLFVYALGRGVPIVLAGTFTGALKQMRNPGKWSPVIEKASGFLMIGVGFYFLWIA